MSLRSWWKTVLSRIAKSRIMMVNSSAALLFTVTTNFPLLQASLPDDIYGYAGFGLAMINGALRMTKQSGDILPPKADK